MNAKLFVSNTITRSPNSRIFCQVSIHVLYAPFPLDQVFRSHSNGFPILTGLVVGRVVGSSLGGGGARCAAMGFWAATGFFAATGFTAATGLKAAGVRWACVAAAITAMTESTAAAQSKTANIFLNVIAILLQILVLQFCRKRLRLSSDYLYFN